MKKFSLLTIIAVLLTFSYTNAQISSYTFTSTAGTYTPITGGTAIRYGSAVTNASVTTATLDDDVYYNRPIGFNFTYNGAIYTSFGFNSNGWLILGSSTSFSSTSTPISTTTASINNVISVGAVDLFGGIQVGGTVVTGNNFITVNATSPVNGINVGDSVSGSGIPGTGAIVTAGTSTTVTIDKNTTSGSTSASWRVKNGEIRYETIGSSPNRTLVLQFTSFARYTSATAGDRANFQIRLTETTNTAQVVYSGWSSTYTGTSATLQTGLKGAASTDYNNRTTTSNWSASTAGTTNTAAMTFTSTVFPADGLTYTWAPLPTPTVDLSVTAITPSNTSVCPTSNYPVMVTIQNLGTNTIDFSSSNAAIAVAITGASPQNLSTTVSSGTLASGASRVITITPGANFSVAGVDSIRATVTISGDGNSNNNSFATIATVSTVGTTPINEGFPTTTIPTGWTTTRWTIGSIRGVNGNPGNNIYKNLFSSATTGEFTTITVGSIASTDSLKFDYKLVNYSSPYDPPATGWGNYKVQVSTDCGTTYTTIDSITASTNTWITKGYSLSAYAGQRLKVRILAAWASGDWDLAFDNFKIETPLPCATPTAASVNTITSTSAAVNFTSTGSSFVAEYSTTRFTPGTGANAGTGGTVVTGTSSPITLTSLTPATKYYVYLRQNCSAAGNGYSTNLFVDSFTTLALAPTSCATNISPANGATGLVPPITLTWGAVTGATSYTVYVGTANPPTDSIATVTTTSTTITGGAPNTTYYWYVVPKNNGGAATGCSANTYRFTTGGGPANDACANATNLTVSNGFCSAPALGTLAFADSTTGLGAATCASTALKYDVWYKVVVPATGNVTVQTSAVNTTVTDLVLQAYSGSCGSLTAIGCDDDGNPAPSGTPSAAHAKLGLTGRTPGEVVYFRVMPYSTASIGAFSICAFDTTASVLPVIAAGSRGTCTAATTVVADSAWKYAWVPLKDASGNIIAELYPNGNVLGSTTASFYINGGAVRRDPNGIYYLDRNITITPANQPTSAVTTRLYFTTAELNTFVTAAGATTRSQLNVSKTSQTCAASAVAAAGTLLSQSTSAAYGADNYVEVSNTSFSTFYLHKGTTPLPIKFEYLTGKKAGTTNTLNWKVTCTSTSITMVLERSADARTFNHNVTSISATQARCGQPFDAVDAAPINGISYYRLKMIDVDGKVSYSPVAAVLNGKAGAELVGVYPTVVKDQAYLSITSSRNTTMQFSISDMSGKVIKTINQAVSSGSSMLPVSTSNLATGVYNITGLLDGVRTQTLRFVKQ